MTAFRIPWAEPFLGDEEQEAVMRVIGARRLSMGAEVQAFEGEAAALVHRRHGVAVSNGTAAVELALTLMDVGPGDGVLVSALSHIATVNAIVHRGATPVFCDVHRDSLNIDLQDAAGRIDGATRAILLSDYCGSAVDYDAARELADAHRLVTVLDGAQTLCSTYRGAPTCSLTTIAATSFHTAKALFCGEGGMVFTDDEAVADRARRLRQMGEVPGRKYVHEALSRNMRITDVAAAVGRVQLGRADAMRARRAELASWYREALEGMPGVTPVVALPECVPVWFSLPILIPHRDRVAQRMAAEGVETRSLYPVPAYRQPIPEYAPYADELRPNAEWASRHALNLPLYWTMTREQVELVVRVLAEALAWAPEMPVVVSGAGG